MKSKKAGWMIASGLAAAIFATAILLASPRRRPGPDHSDGFLPLEMEIEWESEH